MIEYERMCWLRIAVDGSFWPSMRARHELAADLVARGRAAGDPVIEGFGGWLREFRDDGAPSSRTHLHA